MEDFQSRYEAITRCMEPRSGVITVIRLDNPTVYPVWLVPGTVTCIAGVAGDGRLRELHTYAQSHDWSAFSQALNEAETMAVKGGGDGEGQAIPVEEISAVGDLWYGDRAVVRGFLATRSDRLLITDLLAYAGGEIKPEQLHLECMVGEGGVNLECLAVINPVEQSDLEEVIHRTLSADGAGAIALQASPLNFTVAATRKVAEGVVTYITGKAVDNIVRQERQAAERRERLLEQVDRQTRRNARDAMERRYHQHRNASALPPAAAAEVLQIRAVDQSQLAERLLEARLDAIRQMFYEISGESEDNS